MLTCGIDEAGRGPLIGPMVMAGAMFDESGVEKLKLLGVKDSKLLPHAKRVYLSGEIWKIAKAIEYAVVLPEEIDAAVESQTTNLNWLEAEKTALILNKLRPEKAYVDCPSTNVNAYRDFLWERLQDKHLKLVLEHKADVKYLEASAASILAKVMRDEEIEKLKKKIGMDFGSGYPADERTRKFLQDHWKRFPELFRRSWQSYKNVAIEKQSNLKGF